MYNQEKFIKDLDTVLSEVREMLIYKNREYGDSVLSPNRIFSKADQTEQIRVRIDDKLNRIINQTNSTEDSVGDLLGYLVIYKIAELRKNNADV